MLESILVGGALPLKEEADVHRDPAISARLREGLFARRGGGAIVWCDGDYGGATSAI